MIGPDAAATSVADYLRAIVPDYLAVFRTQTGLAALLPDPVVITAADLPEIGMESWPAVMVIPERLEALAQLGNATAGGGEFDAQYGISVESYVVAGDPETAGRINRAYAIAIRSALLATRTLRRLGADWADAAPRVDVESLTEDYMPAFDAQKNRYAATTRVAFTLHQQETPPTVGTGAGVRIDAATVEAEVVGPAQPMPIHPALT